MTDTNQFFEVGINLGISFFACKKLWDRRCDLRYNHQLSGNEFLGGTVGFFQVRHSEKLEKKSGSLLSEIWDLHYIYGRLRYSMYVAGKQIPGRWLMGIPDERSVNNCSIPGHGMGGIWKDERV